MKITKYILSLAAAIGMIAGCQKAELVQMLPADQAVAPVLSDLPDTIKITPLNMAVDSVVFNWTSADFGVSTQVTYAIEVAEKGGATKAIVSSGITDTTAVLYYETINVALFEGLELLDAVATDVEFYVSAYTGESAKIYSAGVPVNATATAAERDYPKMTVVGDYQGWAPGKGQYVFDFAGTDETYSGIVGFGVNDYDMTKNEFKITGTDWGADNGEHSVPEGTEVAAEADKIPLTKGGGSNVSAYKTKKFYHLTFDKKTPQLIKNFAFDQVGVIGVNGDWDNDVVMNFHVAKQRFYADVEFTADGNFKFRADAGWDLNWGVKDGVVTAGGDNIEAKAGKYRVYLNLNNPDNITYELNAKAYGIEEGTTPAPEPEPETPVEVKGWNLIGVGGNWDNDVLMSDVSGFRAALDVALKAGEGFKLRLDGKWDDNRGLKVGEGVEEENVTIAVGEALDVVKDGKNMTVPADGNYDIYYDNANEKLYVLTAGSNVPGSDFPVSEWGIIGVNGNWDTNVTMFENGDWIFAKGVTFAANNEFKFRKGNTWGTELVYEGDVIADTGYPCAAGSGNSKMVAGGTYDVYLKADLTMFYLMTEGTTPDGATGEASAPEKPAAPVVTENSIATGVTALEEDSIYGVIGVDGNWTTDIMMKKTSDEKVFMAAGVTLKADGGFKVRKAGAWDDAANFGLENDCAPLAVNKGYVVITSGGSNNMTVAAGTYDIWFHLEKMHVYVMEAGKHPSEAK